MQWNVVVAESAKMKTEKAMTTAKTITSPPESRTPMLLLLHHRHCLHAAMTVIPEREETMKGIGTLTVHLIVVPITMNTVIALLLGHLPGIISVVLLALTLLRLHIETDVVAVTPLHPGGHPHFLLLSGLVGMTVVTMVAVEVLAEVLDLVIEGP